MESNEPVPAWTPGYPITDPTKLTTDAVEKLRLEIVLMMIAAEKLVDYKFDTVQGHFVAVETQRVEQKTDAAAGLAAALAAAEKAINAQTLASERSIAKSDAATTEQIKQVITTFTTAIAGLTVVVTDLKDRVVKIESLRLGGQQSTDERRASSSSVYAAFGALLTLITIVSVLIAAFKK